MAYVPSGDGTADDSYGIPTKNRWVILSPDQAAAVAEFIRSEPCGGGPRLIAHGVAGMGVGASKDSKGIVTIMVGYPDGH